MGLFFLSKVERQYLAQLKASVDCLNQHLSDAQQTAMGDIMADRLNPLWRGSMKLVLTPIRLQFLAMGIAQTIGLLTWEQFGNVLPTKTCLEVARALTVCELGVFIADKKQNKEVARWFMECINSGVLNGMAGSPVMLSSLGKHEVATRIVTRLRNAAGEDLADDAIERTIADVLTMGLGDAE